ncbi:MAG: YcfL family protein [Phycisphaerae bacterium]|nr:YcfL family protein [Phycisphaerae bacterium]
MQPTQTDRSSWLATLLVATSLALVCGSCTSSNVYETENARPNAIEFKSKISNSSLKDKIDVVSVYVGQASGLLRVQANVVNGSDYNARYMYKVTWYDGQGLKLPANSDFWTRREMNAGGKDEIAAIAPSGKAADWRLEIRPWDN